jgi:hypothetical protein
MGNKLPAFDIFKMSISYLKKEAEKMLKEKKQYYNLEFRDAFSRHRRLKVKTKP